VRALELLLDRPEQTAGQVYNIGSSQEVTINQLAEKVVEHTDTTSAIIHIPYSEAYAPGFEDLRRRVPDTTKLYKATGWQPQRDLDQILHDVVAYEQKLLNREHQLA
jgi:UDP-glucose 4-epimerase